MEMRPGKARRLKRQGLELSGLSTRSELSRNSALPSSQQCPSNAHNRYQFMPSNRESHSIQWLSSVTETISQKEN
jgi:hypothetical protein